MRAAIRHKACPVVIRYAIIAYGMIQNVLRTALFCVLAGALRAQPGIGQNGVANAASQIPPTLPGGAIALGARFTIRGVRLGSPGHTQVTISRNGAATPLKTFGISSGRIDARMSHSAPVGSDLLVVSVDGKASKAFPLEVSTFNPGLYSRNGEGWGSGRIDNIEPSGAHTANSEVNPARPGRPGRAPDCVKDPLTTGTEVGPNPLAYRTTVSPDMAGELSPG